MNSILSLALATAASLGPDDPASRPAAAPVTDVAFLDSGDALVAVTGDGRLQLRSGPGASVARFVSLHDGSVRALALSPGRDRAATAGEDGRVRVVDLATLEPVVDVAHSVLALGYSTDGQTLRAVTTEGELLALDPATGAVRDRHPYPDVRDLMGAWIFGDLVVHAYADG